MQHAAMRALSRKTHLRDRLDSAGFARSRRGRYPPGMQFPRYLAPFNAWKYHQGEIMQKIVENSAWGHGAYAPGPDVTEQMKWSLSVGMAQSSNQ